MSVDSGVSDVTPSLKRHHMGMWMLRYKSEMSGRGGCINWVKHAHCGLSSNLYITVNLKMGTNIAKETMYRSNQELALIDEKAHHCSALVVRGNLWNLDTPPLKVTLMT